MVIRDFSRLKLLYAFSILFIALNAAMIMHGYYWLLAFPLALAFVGLFFFSMDKLLLLIVAITPFSFRYTNLELGFSVNIPTEPLIVVLMVLFFLKLIYERDYDRQVLRHPLTIIILLQLLWMLVTTVTSELPLVSLKFFMSRMWFVIVFYFLTIRLFKSSDKMRWFPWVYAVPLAIIVIYITFIHSLSGFERFAGISAVKPFFNDHTNYGATLALVAPVFAIMAFFPGYKTKIKRISFILFFLFAIGILFSYSRASWLSLAAALGVFLVLVFRINFKLLIAAAAIAAGFFFLYQEQIMINLERNTQESSGDFSEHVQSISNITSDASNLERINRWRSAIRMYQERPVLGWGPGTYQFVYAPFQLSEDYTIITTHFGDLGNAHSEYLGPLSESGMPGMVLMLLLVTAVIYTAVKNYKYNPNKELRWISLGILLGFVSYFIHGLLNNFLDTDKVSVPFWGFLAILVAIDVFHGVKRDEKNIDS